eukprot:1965457-Alexandrium_andersonii.AAC.1
MRLLPRSSASPPFRSAGEGLSPPGPASHRPLPLGLSRVRIPAGRLSAGPPLGQMMMTMTMEETGGWTRRRSIA